jgi:hypothetical protein
MVVWIVHLQRGNAVCAQSIEYPISHHTTHLCGEDLGHSLAGTRTNRSRTHAHYIHHTSSATRHTSAHIRSPLTNVWYKTSVEITKLACDEAIVQWDIYDIIVYCTYIYNCTFVFYICKWEKVITCELAYACKSNTSVNLYSLKDVFRFYARPMCVGDNESTTLSIQVLDACMVGTPEIHL